MRSGPPSRGVGLAVAVLLGLAAPARAEEEPALEPSPEVEPAVRSLEDLGFDPQRLLRHAKPALDVPFVTRSDEVLLRARLRLRFRRADRALPEEVTGLEVLLNGEVLTVLPRSALFDEETLRLVDLDARLLSGRDVLGLRLAGLDPCRPVPVGAWAFVADGRIETEGTALPVPNALELLPAPFVDDDFERRPRLSVVLSDFGLETIEAAAVLVGGLATRVDARLRFEVSSELPPRHAVVLVRGPGGAARLGLPFHHQPSAEVVDHPRATNAKLLVVSGADAEELRVAALALFQEEGVNGPLAHFRRPPPAAPSAAYGSPRWMDPSRPITLEHVRGGPLVHRGLGAGTLRASFRVAPDLFGWPRPSHELVVDFRRRASPKAPPARLVVEMNGTHLGTLRVTDETGRASSERLWVPRETLRGFNELVIHVDHAEDACSLPEDPVAEVEIGASTALHLEGLVHYAELPDVELFVHDGYPFTVRADLSETAAILPAEPSPREIATLLSVVAHLAAITGRAGTGIRLVPDEPLPRAPLDRHLLVIGGHDRNKVFGAWARAMPVTFAGARGIARDPDPARSWRRALRGRLGFDEVDRAQARLDGHPASAVVAGFPSPLAPDRIAMALTAAHSDDLQDIDAFLGFAEGRYRGGDVLVADPTGALARFELGLPRPSGTLDPWTQVRWVAARHWVLLVVAAFLALVALAPLLGGSLEARARRRLAAGAWPSPAGIVAREPGGP